MFFSCTINQWLKRARPLLFLSAIALLWGCAIPQDGKLILEYSGPVTVFYNPKGTYDIQSFDVTESTGIYLQNHAADQWTVAYARLSRADDALGTGIWQADQAQIMPGLNPDFLASRLPITSPQLSATEIKEQADKSAWDAAAIAFYRLDFETPTADGLGVIANSIPINSNQPITIQGPFTRATLNLGPNLPEFHVTNVILARSMIDNDILNQVISQTRDGGLQIEIVIAEPAGP